MAVSDVQYARHCGGAAKRTEEGNVDLPAVIPFTVDAKGNFWAASNDKTTRLLYQRERNPPSI